MPSPFTTTKDPWIPVVIRTSLDAGEQTELTRLMPGACPGERHCVGLEQLLAGAHFIADLDLLHPPVEAVLRRFLAAITARVTGLDAGSGDDWADARDKVLADRRIHAGRVSAYLTEHGHRLVLHGPRPFLQDPRLGQECSEPAAPGRLAMDRASGNNAIWNDHTAQDAPLAAGDAAGWLLAWHGFGPSGTAAVRKHKGRNTKIAKAGPYRSLISYFPHAPGDLFTTLVVSIPSPTVWPTNDGEDLAPWETDVLPDPLNPAAPAGPVSLLTARTAHACLLTPGGDGRVTGVRVAWGVSSDLPAAVDPYLVDRAKGGPLRADRTRAVFRDLDALLLKRRPGSKDTVRRPTVFDSIADLPPEILSTLGVRAIGWDQDKQDKSYSWYTATTPPVLHHLEERDQDGAAAIATLRAHTEAAASGLYKALSVAWHSLNTGRKPDERAALTGPAVARFYARAESEFWQCVEDTTRRPRLQRIALAVFDEATSTMNTTVRGMQAVAKARAKLTTAPKAPRASKK